MTKMVMKLASIAVQDESDGKAQYMLAKIIEEDFGNSQAAIEWYRRAVLNENKEASFNVRYMLLEILIIRKR